MADLESVNKRLSDICSDVALVQISIAETAAKVRDTATSAGHVKSLWAQAVSTMSRMEWEDGRNWVCGVARSSLYLMAGNEMAEMRRVLDACGEAVMHDEGIESGGEMEVDLGEVQDGDDDSTDGEDHTSFSTSKRFCFDAIKSSDPPDHEMVPEYAQYLVNLDSVLEAIEETDEDEESDEELVKVSVKTVEVIREKGSRVKDVEVAQFKMETGGDFSQ